MNMKRLALLFIFIAAIGSLSGQSVKNYSLWDWRNIPKNTNNYNISELITQLGSKYVVRMWGNRTYYAKIDEQLNIIDKVAAPEMRVQFKYVDGSLLHLIGFPGEFGTKEIIHYTLNMSNMEFWEPRVLAKQEILAKTKGKSAKEIREYDFFRRRKYHAEMANFNNMLAVQSANKRYILIAPYYYNYKYVFGKNIILGDAFCSSLMLFDNKMNKLAEHEMIDTFMVRYNQIDSARSDRFNDGKQYYYRPQKFTNLCVNITDEGLVTALYSRKELHKISGSEFAVSLLYPDGRYESIELGKIMGDENMDRPFILKCDGKKLLFEGFYTAPTERYYLIHYCKVYGIGTYEVDLTTREVKMVDRKEFEDSLAFEDVSSYIWKSDSGWVTEMSKTVYYPKTLEEDEFYAVYGSCYASIDNDGKIRRAVSNLKCEDDSTTVSYPKMVHPMVHNNQLYYLSRNKDYVYVMDYLCRVRGEVMGFNPYRHCRERNGHLLFLKNTGYMSDNEKHVWLGITNNSFNFGRIKFVD